MGNLLIATQVWNIPRNTSVFLETFETASILLDDGGWYNSTADIIELPTGRYRCTLNISSQDGNISTTSQIFAGISMYDYNLPGYVNTLAKEERLAGSVRPCLNIHGIVRPDSLSALSVAFSYTDPTADRDWFVNWQVEQV